MAPGNKGKKLPPEILSREEVSALFAAVSGEPVLATRTRAMLALMYHAELKVGTVVRLRVGDYEPQTGMLRVPGIRGAAASRVRLDTVTRGSLDDWLKTRASLRVRPMAPLFCTIRDPIGNQVSEHVVRNALERLAQKAGIQKRVKPEGLRRSRQEHREAEAGRFEATIASYINAESFRERYGSAYRNWVNGHQLLEIDPSQATTIGHLCREAVMDFSDELVRVYEAGEFERTQTKQKVRAVFARHKQMSGTVRRSLEALLTYWETVSDLVNRQEHAQELTAEDSRRIVFQTMLVMREIDSALTR